MRARKPLYCRCKNWNLVTANENWRLCCHAWYVILTDIRSNCNAIKSAAIVKHVTCLALKRTRHACLTPYFVPGIGSKMQFKMESCFWERKTYVHASYSRKINVFFFFFFALDFGYPVYLLQYFLQISST